MPGEDSAEKYAGDDRDQDDADDAPKKSNGQYDSELERSEYFGSVDDGTNPLDVEIAELEAYSDREISRIEASGGTLFFSLGDLDLEVDVPDGGDLDDGLEALDAMIEKAIELDDRKRELDDGSSNGGAFL